MIIFYTIDMSLKIAHVNLDFFDDNGSLLREYFPDVEDLPSQIKTASLNPPEIDDDYALVMQNGNYKIRKFACNDVANTAISTLYFLENYEKLPDQAVKTAAVNLVDSMNRFNLYIPEELRRLANVLDDDGEVETRSKYKAHDNLKVIEEGNAGQKLAFVEPKYKILNKYPIDNEEHLKIAETYFEEHLRDFTPNERRQFALEVKKIANIMPEILSYKHSNLIEKYASNSYGCDDYIIARRFYSPDSEKQVLDYLIEKKAYVSPDSFAEALKEYDLVNGLDKRWDREIKDPYYSTFAKMASEDDIWWNYEDDEGHRITRKALEDLSEDTSILKKQFGHEFVNAFINNPKGTFEDAPKNIKKIIVRLALRRM